MGSLFDELTWRGLVHQHTDPSVPELLDKGGLTVYIGFDPTAPSLHIGHLLQLCNLRRLHDGGHRPIPVVGGATGMIGDPGGRSDERNLLDSDELAENVAGIRRQVEELVPGVLVEDNGSWLKHLSAIDFLRDVGKHFTVNHMVAKESVKARFEGRDEGISYTEFSYMLLQAYDYLHLFDTHGCTLQMGASDQWGNITAGIDLIRKVRGASVYGLTTPLVLKADGTKFGKSASGTVWLDAARTSPYELFQFLVRSEDTVVGQYLRYFTWLPQEEIAELERVTVEHPERREAQRALAVEVTTLVHGKAEAERALLASQALFSEDIAMLDERTLLGVFADAPSTDRSRGELDGEGLGLVEVLVGSGLASSNGDARRAFPGVYVNNVKVADPERRLTSADLLHGAYIVVRKGKRSFHLLRFG
ncbi:MAG: Tyrosyl-tRNA synthetase [uncultured Acidimicrobiales bacterium]|uniref:Tyrosine--tRNA ligase n=1 Tax=uncultured Acidimicrobiales bacterium TaxID=310071 RepID=A0A6J4H6Y3_9ACTN|nr:MAG: Tyrosyl-tRNA synthetase [uncultured Acidimicrobiales bacterium]